MDSETTVEIGIEVVLSGVGGGEELEIWITVLDCDSGGVFALRDLVLGLNSFTPLNCGGEEIYEKSGGHDVAGTVVKLPPAEWKRGGERAYRVAGSGLDYTAYVQLRVRAY